MRRLGLRAGSLTATGAATAEPTCATRKSTLTASLPLGTAWWLLAAVMACTLEPQPIELPVAEDSSPAPPQSEAAGAFETPNPEATEPGADLLNPSAPDPSRDSGQADGSAPDLQSPVDANAPDAGAPGVTSPDGGAADSGLDPVDDALQSNGPDAG